MKVQTGAPEGKEKSFCSPCQKAFFVAAGTQVTSCPQGHAAQEVDDLAPVGETDGTGK